MNASSVVFGMFLGFILTWIYMTIRHDLQQQATDRDRLVREKEQEESSRAYVEGLQGRIQGLESELDERAKGG